MAKHIHIHLHKPAKDSEITMKKSKVEEKCRNGEWEAMQDIVANRTLQFRNTRNGRTFFVKVEHDASLSDFERADIKKWYDFYKSKSSSELVEIYKKSQRVSASFTAGEVGGKQGLVDMLLRDKFGQRRLEAFYNKDAGFGERVEYDPRETARLKDKLKRFKAQLAELNGNYTPAAVRLKRNLEQEIAEVESELKHYRDASPESDTLKKEIETLEEEYEKRRDRGVTVTPSDMKKLQDLKDKLKKLES